VEALGPIVSRLSLDELFSTFGAYELARVLLPDGFGVWGPSWYFVGDNDCFCPVQDARPVRLEADELAEKIDRRIFWHCFPDQALVGFGIYDENKLVAVASVRAEGNGWKLDTGAQSTHPGDNGPLECAFCAYPSLSRASIRHVRHVGNAGAIPCAATAARKSLSGC
jgi:hypothetical protein